ncbi:TIGR02281 family clan AA aspartic protease [Yoonia sp.]|uniref:retropepsin-like aspartic protease family protein n=1 Tax=Yoonia sp. TaxID=2212373 RepID=UPI0019E48B54|nr:TIGR02281 family clan AA aspartic protease [Yoonia sp.]MBE0412872.1 TIGR02281 family clan AA aspartic protease [Yoonia sp.]
MTSHQIMQLVYLGLLGAAIAGAFFVSNRNSLGKNLQQGAIWVLIFIGVIGVYGLWNDIARNVTSRQAIITNDQIAVPRSADGHYYLTLDVNDTPVRFVVDTGATQVVLAREDALRIGINANDLAFYGSAITANGIVRTAPVLLEKVALGPIIDRQLPAVVNGGEMDASLLGMTYLSRFDRIEIANGELVLSR